MNKEISVFKKEKYCSNCGHDRLFERLQRVNRKKVRQYGWKCLYCNRKGWDNEI